MYWIFVSDKDSSQECWLKIAYPNKTMNDGTWNMAYI